MKIIKPPSEIWRDIPGYEGFYQASSFGRIKSLKRIRKNGKGACYEQRERILKTHISPNGYSQVTLSKLGKLKQANIHRLIAMSFIPNPKHLPEINHRNENKQDNCISNLEWCSRSYNNNYGTRNQRTGVANSKKVFQFDANGNLIHAYQSAHAAIKAVKSKIGRGSLDCICKVCRNERKRAYGYIWSYERKKKCNESNKTFV
jgi:hypothetical protein